MWRFSEVLRTFQVTGNTGLKVSLKFLLSLCILRYLNTLKTRHGETPGMLCSSLLAQGSWLGRTSQECSDKDLSARECLLGSCVPDFVWVPERIGWEQEDQQGGWALPVCSALKWAPQGWREPCPSMQLQIPAFLHSPFLCDLASSMKEVFLPIFWVVWNFIFHSASICRAFGLPDAASN